MDNLTLDRDPREMRVGRPQSIASIKTIHSSISRYSNVPTKPARPKNVYFQPGRAWRAISQSPGEMELYRKLFPVKELSDSQINLISTLDVDMERQEVVEDDRYDDDRSSISSSTTFQEKELPLPPKHHARPARLLRYTILNVYRRLFSIVFLANVVGLIYILHDMKDAWSLRSMNASHLATAASANIMIGTAIRQDYVINMLFRTSWLVPHSAPLRLRRMVAKIYEFGGVHSSTGVCGTLWFILLTIVLTTNYLAKQKTVGEVLVTITYSLAIILVTIIILAHPIIRFKHHNLFELSHRFFGWLAIALFWAQLLLSVHEFNPHALYHIALLKSPAFWFLIIITFHTVLPWLFLRKWSFRAEKLSDHAVRLHFEKRLPPFVGIQISKSPLKEWHPFATFPSLTDEPTGGSLIVSSAGDWTKQVGIDASASANQEYWVRGRPRTGVLSMSCIFKRVVIVTTGSGIGPCLGVMMDAVRQRGVEIRVLWSAPSTLGIYGKEIVDAVRSVDESAVLIDTRAKGGRPDMVMLAYQLYCQMNAEAVFVISNPMLTRKIVYGMESRGIPAFGPIWDS